MTSTPGTCCRRRSRLTTPLAVLLGAVLVSGTSAYAAAQITGAQIADNSVASADITNNSLTTSDIKDLYVTGNDIAQETLTGAKIKNGTLGPADLAVGSVGAGAVRDGTIGAADLQPGVANKLVNVLSQGGQTRAPNEAFYLTSDSTTPLTLKAGQRVVISGYASYFSQNAVLFFIGTCAYVQGASAVAIINSDFVSFQGNVHFPVSGLYTAASDQTVTVGPCASQGATPPAVAIVPQYSRWTLTVVNP